MFAKNFTNNNEYMHKMKWFENYLHTIFVSLIFFEILTQDVLLLSFSLTFSLCIFHHFTHLKIAHQKESKKEEKRKTLSLCFSLSISRRLWRAYISLYINACRKQEIIIRLNFTAKTLTKEFLFFYFFFFSKNKKKTKI